MDTILNLSYLLSAMGVVLCIVAYFVVPKVLRSVLSDDAEAGSDSDEV